MILTKGLIAKAALALAGVASATTVGIVYKDQISSAFGSTPAADQETEVVNKTKWDDRLLSFLDAGGKIGFKVTKLGESGGAEEEVTSPESETFEATKNYFVRIGTSDTGTLTSADGANDANSPGNSSYIKKVNGEGDGTEWTWECKITLNKESGDDAQITDLKSKFTEFLTKIKSEDTSNKDLKKKFIEKCAEARTSEINKKLKALDSLTSITSETISKQEANKIKAEKTFNMVNSDGSTLKIKAEDEQTFKDFFSITN